jgi:hypothetical protein
MLKSLSLFSRFFQAFSILSRASRTQSTRGGSVYRSDEGMDGLRSSFAFGAIARERERDDDDDRLDDGGDERKSQAATRCRRTLELRA